MKIAFFNIQNLFFRHRDFMKAPCGKCVQNWMTEMDLLVRKIFKSARDLDRMQELAFLLRIEELDHQKYAVLRSRGASLFIHSCEFPVQEKASDGNGWNGWVEVENYPIDPKAISNKARLLAETDADVVLLQEVEDRFSLSKFNHRVLKQFPFERYQSSVLVQGNDPRGQEQALLYRKGYQVNSMKLYTDEINRKGGLLFDKNCLVYELKTPEKKSFWILTAQLNDSGKNKQEADETRLEQTQRLAGIYHKMQELGMEYIIVAGTFGTVSYCYSMIPLLQDTDLKDICRHPSFNATRDKNREGYHSLGAYSKGINIKQKDYLLLSPSLYSKVKSCGMNRRGVWPKKKGQWPVYYALREEAHQASEHPVLWVNLFI